MDSNKNNINNGNLKETNITDDLENVVNNQKDSISILVNIILLALIRLKLREQETIQNAIQETNHKIEQQDNLSDNPLDTIKPCLKDE